MFQTVTFFSLKVKHQMAYIPLILFHLFPGPIALPATFNENTRDSKRSCVIVSTTCRSCRANYIFHANVSCHMEGSICCFIIHNTYIIYIWMQLFISVTTVKINIIICYRKKLRYHCMGDTVSSCSVRVSREYTVQILAILVNHTHGPVLKSADIDKRNHDHISLQILWLKLFSQFHGSLNSYVFRTMYTCCDQNRRSILHSADHSCRHAHATSCDFDLTLCFLSLFYHPVINFDHWPFSFLLSLYFRTHFE